MGRIFLYEIRRTMLSKFYIGLFIIGMVFSFMSLRTNIIRGVANTAPFSPWSWGYYISMISPLLVVTMLFLTIMANTAKRVDVLTKATAISDIKYMFIKNIVILIAWTFMAICMSTLGVIFLHNFFKEAVSLGELVLPTIIALVPLMILTFAVGIISTRIHVIWLAVFIAVIALVSLLPLPKYIGLIDMAFFADYPLKLGTLDPEFSVTASVIISKVLYIVAGGLMILISLKIDKNNHQKS